jgi:hypothetical protein
MIGGIVDRLIPPNVAYDYASSMRRKHATPVELVDIPAAGHFDLVIPNTRLGRGQSAYPGGTGSRSLKRWS